MTSLINKIIIKIGNYKVNRARKANKKTKSFLRNDYFICRVCKKVQPGDEMDPKDKSICMDCSEN